MTVVCLPSCAAESNDKMKNGEIIATSPFFLCFPHDAVDDVLGFFSTEGIENLP